jgi:thiol-disulfide isomerase/thioredoxin
MPFKKVAGAAVRAGLLAIAVIAMVAVFTPQADRFKDAEERKPLAEFRLPAIDGSSWALSDQKGRVVLLNFWTTWCPPCRAETPALVELSRRYGPAGLSVAGISLDEEPLAVVPAFAAQSRIPYPILTPDASFGLASTIDTLPTTMLLDRQGRVVRTYAGAIAARSLAADIERVLAE